MFHTFESIKQYKCIHIEYIELYESALNIYPIFITGLDFV